MVNSVGLWVLGAALMLVSPLTRADSQIPVAESDQQLAIRYQEMETEAKERHDLTRLDQLKFLQQLGQPGVIHFRPAQMQIENLTQRDRTGQALLHLAVATTDPRALERVLALHRILRVSVDLPDNRGDSALHIAFRHGDFDAINALRAAGADPCRLNLEGQWPDLALTDFRNEIQRISGVGIPKSEFDYTAAHPTFYTQFAQLLETVPYVARCLKSPHAPIPLIEGSAMTPRLTNQRVTVEEIMKQIVRDFSSDLTYHWIKGIKGIKKITGTKGVLRIPQTTETSGVSGFRKDDPTAEDRPLINPGGLENLGGLYDRYRKKRSLQKSDLSLREFIDQDLIPRMAARIRSQHSTILPSETNRSITSPGVFGGRAKELSTQLNDSVINFTGSIYQDDDAKKLAIHYLHLTTQTAWADFIQMVLPKTLEEIEEKGAYAPSLRWAIIDLDQGEVTGYHLYGRIDVGELAEYAEYNVKLIPHIIEAKTRCNTLKNCQIRSFSAISFSFFTAD